MLSLEVAGEPVSLLVLAALGLAAGLMAGMFGIGGGFFITPALNMVCGIPMSIAVSSSLCQQIGTSVGSFLKHRQLRGGEPWIDMYMLGGGLMGAHAGALGLAALENLGELSPFGQPVPAVKLVLQLLYVAFLLVTLVPTLRGMRRRAPTAPGTRDSAALLRVSLPPMAWLPNLGVRASVPVMAYIGFLAGFMSGLLGVGGGILILPILVYGMGLRLRDAAGTGIIVLFVNVVWGTGIHAWAGNVHLGVALGVLAGSAIGTQLGARTTHSLSSRALNRWFAGLLAFTIAAIVYDLAASLL